MAQITFHKIPHNGTINRNNAVYFKQLASPNGDYYYNIVTDSSGSQKKLAIGNGDVYFSAATYTTNTVGSVVGIEGTSEGMSRQILLGAGLIIATEGTEKVLRVDTGSLGGGTMSSFTVHAITGILETSVDTGTPSYNTSAKGVVDNDNIRFRFIAQTDKKALISARDGSSSNPEFRRLFVGVTDSSPASNQLGDLWCEASAYVHATAARIIIAGPTATNAAGYIKQAVLEPSSFLRYASGSHEFIGLNLSSLFSNMKSAVGTLLYFDGNGHPAVGFSKKANNDPVDVNTIIDGIRFEQNRISLGADPDYFGFNSTADNEFLTFIPTTANYVFAGPTTGSPAKPTFRLLVWDDLPAGVASETYVNNAIQGLKSKKSVRAATLTNIANLAGGAPSVVDGVTLVQGNRVLVKEQSNAALNGIYVVQTLGTGSNGTWVRSDDMDAWSEVPSAYTWVEEGTALQDTGWYCPADQGGTLGTTVIPWNQFSSSSVISAGIGLLKSGNEITFATTATGTGLVQSGDRIDGILFQNNKIALAFNNTYFQITTGNLNFLPQGAYTFFGNNTGSSALPTDISVATNTIVGRGTGAMVLSAGNNTFLSRLGTGTLQFNTLNTQQIILRGSGNMVTQTINQNELVGRPDGGNLGPVSLSTDNFTWASSVIQLAWADNLW